MLDPKQADLGTRLEPPRAPLFPASYRPGIGIIGCGAIVKARHLPAYNTHGLRIIGAYDIFTDATRGIEDAFGVEQVFGSVDELLAHPEIEVVDIATGPAPRAPLIMQAIRAGKHVLSQKPLALDLGSAQEIVQEAERMGVRVAVNQNGRYAPSWRAATELIERGEVGDVVSITHLLDRDFEFIVGTHFDEIPHYLIYDYAIHWIDITRCWLRVKTVSAVRASTYRVPNQPVETASQWGGWIEIHYLDGSNAMIRAVGGSATSATGHPFWIHGTAGTIRGSVLGQDFVELEQNGVFHRIELVGDWASVGFAATMGELLSAIAEGREPANSAQNNLLTLELTLAACLSVEEGSRPVALGEVSGLPGRPSRGDARGRMSR